MKNTLKLSNIALVLFMFICASQQSPLPDQVIEIFRHGARGPVFSYDPQWSSSELGKLTRTGMVQHYNIGKSIAQKYPNLVASGYNPDDVYVLANFVERCIESAMVQVSSIFRGTTSTLTNSLPKGLQAHLISKYESLLPASEANRGNYVPVNVNIVSTRDEKLIFNGRDVSYCSKMDDFINENKKSLKRKEAWNTFQEPINQANAKLPNALKINNMDTLITAYDSFIADLFDSRPLPGDITDSKLIGSLGYGFAYDVYILQQNQLIQRQLTSFNTLKGVLDQMANFRAGTDAKKLALFGGHDVNLYSVLAAFGILTEECLLANYESHIKGEPVAAPNCHFPGFASNLIFEFYNETSSPYVKVYYNDVLVPLCNGQDTCSYQDFQVLAQNAGGNNTPESWDQKCGNSNENLLVQKKVPSWVIIAGPALGGIIIVSLLVWWIHLKRKAAAAQKLKAIQKVEQKIELNIEESTTLASPSNMTSFAQLNKPIKAENDSARIEIVLKEL